MPHLQLDVPNRYPVIQKRNLAKRLGNLYAEIMQTTADLVHVTIREVGEGGVWRCSAADPLPSAVLSCEIRRGRPAEQRARLAKALLDACAEILGLDQVSMSVEFTQHAGDEIYLNVLIDGVLHGSLGRDWSPDETEAPLVETMIAEERARA
jgi:phenylpyruvate tautomerase PptA (4-oxalocrotonate tautomerase family)